MVPYVDLIGLCHSVAILRGIYVMRHKCHVRWHNFNFKRMLITRLGQQTLDKLYKQRQFITFICGRLRRVSFLLYIINSQNRRSKLVSMSLFSVIVIYPTKHLCILVPAPFRHLILFFFKIDAGTAPLNGAIQDEFRVHKKAPYFMPD